ncbi:mannosyltransferase family protein [Actinoplanes sp. NEAU-A12]|uniref:Mannosyltransferase family protein n=1 Tax=Actinoplanes sandaracinus TaxID=3045177 RepID=A0ABT6WD93_9ACTN|nr:mannosyltransferase family protein [Actinoplanes sandaracinus]MDI6097668.1 mannosyltransferase family protein [Actinoplanes sandaracinus]
MTITSEKTMKADLWARSGAWNGLLTAVGVLALTRIGQLMMISWLGGATTAPRSVWERLLIWDAGWFLRVAMDGYPDGYTYDGQGKLEGNELAFFPVYPMLIRAGAAIGMDPSVAAVGVAWTASIAAAVALHLLGTALYDRRAGWALVAVCCSAPASVVLSMAYSESLFIALVAGMFVAAHQRVWWAAGLLGLAAALTRPTGAAAALGLAVAAALAMRDSREQRWKPLAAAAAALAGVPLYLGWVAYRVGDLSAWFKIQTAGWGTSFDYGSSTGKFLWTTLRGGDGWIPVSVALILLVALAAAGVALAQKPWLPLAVYGVVAMVLVYGQAGFYHSKPRLLLPVLLTLLPAVAAAARARPRVAILSIAAWALFGLWYGAYLVTVWPFTL